MNNKYLPFAIVFFAIFSANPALSEDINKDINNLKNQVQQLQNQNFIQQHQLQRQRQEMDSYIWQQNEEKKRIELEKEEAQKELKRQTDFNRVVNEKIIDANAYLKRADYELNNNNNELARNMYLKLLQESKVKSKKYTRDQKFRAYYGIAASYRSDGKYNEALYYFKQTKQNFPEKEQRIIKLQIHDLENKLKQ